jgi:hypothetical protein
MLVATRDPSFPPGAPSSAPVAVARHGPGRWMTALQVAGSLLAIPVGLASAYSIYHANFSPESRCQGLRANIVSMLDKSADAATLRMLIRRDVMAFEQTCGAVDPDAVAAFKALLTKKPPAVAQSSPRPAAAPAAPAVAKDGEEKLDQHEGSDAKWLAAVREALVRHAEALPVERNETASPAPNIAAPPPVPAIAPPITAPAVAAAPRPAVPAAAADHPVPPAPIPEAPPVEARTGYRLGELIAHVPLIGGMFGR